MRIELLGASFSIETDEDPAYLKEVVTFFKNKVAEIEGSVSTHDPLKIAILAGILTSDAYLKKSGGTESEEIQAGTIASRLIGELEDALEDTSSGAPF